MRDSRGDRWFVSFDAAGHPEAATGAIAVANKIFWALGYWQVENHLVSVDRRSDRAWPTRRSSRRRPDESAGCSARDLDAVLRRAHRSADGSYRAIAARAVPGRPIGGFKYYGTRPDDPNDVVPHEHRRELRALKVFGAWTNLVDMKAGNTLDAVVVDNGRSVVRHYLQDVGSTFGTGANGPREYDEGWELLYDGGLMRKRLFTPRLLHRAVADRAVRGASGDRPVRGRRVRSAGLAAARRHRGVPARARRRHVLGRAARRGVHRRHDSRRRPHRQLFRSRGRGAARRRADQAAAEDRRGVSARDQPARRLRALRRTGVSASAMRRWTPASRPRRRADTAPAGRCSTTRPARRDRSDRSRPRCRRSSPRRDRCRRTAGAFVQIQVSALEPAPAAVDAARRCVLPAQRQPVGRLSVSRDFRNTHRGDSHHVPRQSTIVALVAAATLAFTVHTALARVDVKVEFDKTFNFKAVRTWGWNPAGPARSRWRARKTDDPDAMKKRGRTVDRRRGDDRDDAAGLQRAAADAGPDRHLLPAADDEHVRADDRAVPAGDDGVGPAAVRAGDAVAEDA